jgi:hypothetical protein
VLRNSMSTCAFAGNHTLAKRRKKNIFFILHEFNDYLILLK